MRESDSFSKDHTPTERRADLVFVSIMVNDGTWFDVLLTRVPCVGEYLSNQGDTFRVTRVQHSPLYEDGRCWSGLQAILAVPKGPIQ